MENTKGVLVLRSFYEAIQCLDKDDQLELYNAIMEYGLNGVEPKFNKKYLNGYLKLIIPNIDSQIKKYKASVENGKKGGKPKQTNITENKTDLSNDNPKVVDEPTSTKIEAEIEDNTPTILDIINALPFSEIEFKLGNGDTVKVCDKYLDLWNKRKDNNKFMQDMRKYNDQFMFSYKLENEFNKINKSAITID